MIFRQSQMIDCQCQPTINPACKPPVFASTPNSVISARVYLISKPMLRCLAKVQYKPASIHFYFSRLFPYKLVNPVNYVPHSVPNSIWKWLDVIPAESWPLFVLKDSNCHTKKLFHQFHGNFKTFISLFKTDDLLN